MESNQTLLMLQIILTLGALLVFGLIYPVIIFFDVIAQSKTQKEKLNWILMIAVTGPLAATIWTYRHSKQSWKKWSGTAGLVALLLSGLFFYNLGREIISEMDNSVVQIQSDLKFNDDVGSDIRDQIQNALTTMRQEFEGYPVSHFVELSMNFRLAVTLKQISGNGLANPQAKFWANLYNNRKNINPYAFDPTPVALEAMLAK